MEQDKLLKNCLVCDSTNLVELIDLGDQPLANSFLKECKKQPTRRLKANLCQECNHGQLETIVPPEEMFTNYSYVSGTTQTLKDHFKSIVDRFSYRLSTESKILDIGANDGSLMREFLELGCQVKGIDPATNLSHLQEGLDIEQAFWNEETAAKQNCKYDIITALNCLAHNPNPKGFLKACKKVMHEESLLVLEFPLLEYTIKSQDFGQFYFEHYSYFSVKSIDLLAHDLGFGVYDVHLLPDIHGGTIRVVLSKTQESWFESIYEYGLYFEDVSFKDFAAKIKKKLNSITAIVDLIEYSASTFVLAGASAKCTTFLNALDRSIGNCLDENPLKQGCFIPNTCTYIRPFDWDWSIKKAEYVVITAHNFKDEIMQKLRDLNYPKDCQVISYIPEILIEPLWG